MSNQRSDQRQGFGDWGAENTGRERRMWEDALSGEPGRTGDDTFAGADDPAKATWDVLMRLARDPHLQEPQEEHLKRLEQAGFVKRTGTNWTVTDQGYDALKGREE